MKINELITDHMDIWTAAQTPKRNGGRGRTSNGNEHSAHGIKRLRELILELAVRGKLVPQDPNDEPASVLLERIAEERKQLVSEGKFKKQKVLPRIVKEELPFKLPQSWGWERLGNIANLVYGKNLPTTKLEADGFEVFGANGIIGKYSSYIYKEPQVLISCRGAYSGKANMSPEKCYVTNNSIVCELTKTSLSKQFLFLLLSAIDKSKIVSGSAQPQVTVANANPIIIAVPPFLEQHRIVTKVNELMTLCDQLEQQQTHSTETHQTLVSSLLATLTQAADSKEFDQAWQRIADHFDTLFTAEAGIDQLKQTLLQLAVMGKLVPQDPNDLPAPHPGKYFVYALECEDKSIYIGQTEDVLNRWKEHAAGKGAEWTKRHPPVRLVHWEEYDSREQAVEREKELKTGFGRKWLKRELAAGRTRQAGEPASVLLETIAKEKKRLIKEGKIKKQKPLPEIGEDEKLFNLPEGWEWALIDKFCNVQGGIQKQPKRMPKNNHYPYLRVANVQRGFIDIGEIERFELEEGEIEKWALESGDILVVEGNGSAEEIGRCAIWEGQIDDCVYQNHLIRVRPYLKSIELFVAKYLNSPSGIEGMKKLAVTTSGLYNLSVGKIRAIPIPIPPMKEQFRILARLDELLTLCDKLKARLKEAQTTQRQLADAIVEQAVA